MSVPIRNPKNEENGQASLEKLRDATRMLGEVRTSREAKALIDTASAAEYYAKKAKLGEEAISYAHTILIEAMALLGQFLKTGPKATGGQPYQATRSRNELVDKPPTLTDLGLTRHDSMQAQHLYAIKTKAPEEFTAVREGKKTVGSAYRTIVDPPSTEKVKRRAGAPAAPTAPNPKRRLVEAPRKNRVAEQNVQRTHALLLEFAARTQPVSRANITRRLGGKTPRDERRQFEAFFDCASHVPWARIETLDGGFHFTVNMQLKQLCDQETPLPELNGWTPQDIVSLYRNLRRTITEMRAASKCERTRRQWNPDGVVKFDLLKLIEFIELELDKITSPKIPPAEWQAEQRLHQPSAGDAEPTKGDTSNVN